MNVTDLYWTGAGVLALIVVVLLILWNVSQIQKQTGRRVKATEEPKSMEAIAPETTEADSGPPTGEEDMAAPQRGSDTPPAGSTDSLEDDLQPDAATAPSNEKIIMFPQSAASADMTQPQSAVGTDDAVARLESSGLVTDADGAAHEQVAGEFRHAEFAEQSAPLVLGREDMDIADEILDEDHILRRAAYETLTDRNDHAADLPEDLRQKLEDPRVLGWLTVHPDGYATASDQPYDESVIDMLATLTGYAARTAEVVGLTEAREFMVRGVEGMIAILPVSRLIAGREGFLVIFLDGETTHEDILAVLDGI
ncbi:MAG: roadblock/LC7 domain-containing protein [Bacilli bacterium]